MFASASYLPYLSERLELGLLKKEKVNDKCFLPSYKKQWGSLTCRFPLPYQQLFKYLNKIVLIILLEYSNLI